MNTTENNKIYLSVVIPSYNEEERIIKTLSGIVSYLEKRTFSFEIIVVDDGSDDDTVKLVSDFLAHAKNIFLIKNELNKGKGYSVKRGVLSARGEIILFSDADLSTPIEEIGKMEPYFDKGYDVVIGSRALAQSNVVVRQPFYRETMGRIFNKLVQFLVIKGIKDTQCGFKCFRKEAAKEVFSRQQLNGFSFDVEVIYIASKLGYKVKEVPVSWYNSPQSRVNALTDSTRMLLDLLIIRFKHFTTRK